MELSERRLADVASARLAASVASFGLGIPQDEILSHQRGTMATSFARHVAMYICHTGFEFSLARVAWAFDRDRSTVAHACHMIENRREEPQFDLWIGTLEAVLRQAAHLLPSAEATR